MKDFTYEISMDILCNVPIYEDKKVGSVVKIMFCSCRGSRFNSQHQHSSSQPLVTLVPGHTMTSSGTQEHQIFTQSTYVQAGKTLINRKYK